MVKRRTAPYTTEGSDYESTALKTCVETYVKTEEDFTVNGSAVAVGPWETWRIVPIDPTHVALLSNFDRYLCTDESYNVMADRLTIGPWETWEVVIVDDTHVAFKGNFGLYLCYDTVAQKVSADRPEYGAWETFEVTPWWVKPIPDPVFEPIQGIPHGDYDSGVCDDTGSRLVVICHAGDLMARYYYDPTSACTRLDEIAAAGYHGVRAWTVLRGSYWEGWGMVITPDMDGYWDCVCRFADELMRRHLRWLVSQGDLCAWTGQDGRKNFMRSLAEHLRDMGGTEALVFGVDAGNETAWNGESEASALREVVDAFTDVLPVPFWSLTSWDEEHPNDYVSGDSIRDLHTTRGPWPQPARRVFNVGYETQPHLFTMYSEPAGLGCQEYAGDNRVGHHVSATAVPSEWNDGDPEQYVTYAACHAIAKGCFVAFFSPGVISDESFNNYQAFLLIPKFYAMLPKDLGSWWTFHGGEGRSFSVDRILAVPSDDGLDVRCDHAAGSGGQRICVAYGPEGTYRLRVVNNFKGVVINPHDLSVEDVEWAKDQTVEFTWKRGRVILGDVW